MVSRPITLWYSRTSRGTVRPHGAADHVEGVLDALHQCFKAAVTASASVPVPSGTGMTSAPSRRMRYTFSA